MQELEFKRALADEMAVVPVPPMISETEMLAAGRRARQRRRATLASAGSAVAVVALIMAVAVTASNDNKPDTATTNPPTTSKRGGDYPAIAGPHYDRGVTLLDTLVELVPPELEAPPSLTSVAEGHEGQPLRYHFANASMQPNPEDDQWRYYATIPVTNANGIAQLSVWVYKPPTEWPDVRGCALSESGWRADITAGCQEVTVAGTAIGVAKERLPTDGAIAAVTKWASYRHSDGTVVFLEQADGYPGANQAWMNQLPLTDQQLAKLATDPRFNLD